MYLKNDIDCVYHTQRKKNRQFNTNIDQTSRHQSPRHQSEKTELDTFSHKESLKCTKVYQPTMRSRTYELKHGSNWNNRNKISTEEKSLDWVEFGVPQKDKGHLNCQENSTISQKKTILSNASKKIMRVLPLIGYFKRDSVWALSLCSSLPLEPKVTRDEVKISQVWNYSNYLALLVANKEELHANKKYNQTWNFSRILRNMKYWYWIFNFNLSYFE